MSNSEVCAFRICTCSLTYWITVTMIFGIILDIYLHMSFFCCNFAAKFDAKEVFMTALQLNADIYQNLAILSQDESMLEKAAKSLRRLVNKMTEDPTCMTKEEFFARVDEAEREIKEGKGITFTNKADMVAWLNSL